MSSLLDNVENSAWHAFEFLALEVDGSATKSKLKVLTSSLGNILDVCGVEKGLDDYRSTSNLTFEQYRYYLLKEVFSALPDTISVTEQRKTELKVDEVCWLICSPYYLERSNPVFPDLCVFQLFRIFCMLAEMVEDEMGNLEVVMAAAEVETVGYHFLSNIGRGSEWSPEEFDQVASVIPAFKFSIFLAVLESKYAKDIDSGTILEAIQDIHDMFILDVIKKGSLKKKMDLLPAYREHWFVLQPHSLTVYSGWSQKEKRGEIPLNSQCRVVNLTESSSKSPNKQKHHKFFLHANEKVYEFQAANHRGRLQWVSCMQKAIEFSGEEARYQRRLSAERKAQRQEDMARRLSQFDIVERTKAELESEKAARIEAEDKAAVLIEQKEVETQRMIELEEVRTDLERLLAEEKQAKRDEEIVRSLQARMLNEEWDKREVLEKMQEEQRQLLKAESEKRSQFERMQRERELQLKLAEEKVKEMEEERKRLDDELKKHKAKVRSVNKGQEVLEAKIKVKEQECEIEKEAASRLTSLNPSASFYVRKREDRPSYMPLRSASMRETSYSRSIRRSRQRTDTLSTRNSILHMEEVNNNSSD